MEYYTITNSKDVCLCSPWQVMWPCCGISLLVTCWALFKPLFLYMLASNCYHWKYGGLAMSSSCLQCTQGCTHTSHWVTLILEKTSKLDHSQASSGVMGRDFCMTSMWNYVYSQWALEKMTSLESVSLSKNKSLIKAITYYNIFILKYYNYTDKSLE